MRRHLSSPKEKSDSLARSITRLCRWDLPSVRGWMLFFLLQYDAIQVSGAPSNGRAAGEAGVARRER